MPGYRLEIPPAEMKKLKDNLLKEFQKRLNVLGYLIVNEIQDNIRNLGLVKTGALMGRIHHKVEGNVLFIMDGTKYGVHLEFGTTSHMVFPKKAKVLAWRKDGKPSIPGAKDKDRFSKGHRVKGIRAYSFFRRVIFNPIKMRELVSKAFQQ